MSNASSVIIVPGYGMAVAQVSTLSEMCTFKKWCYGEYAIHPAAGGNAWAHECLAC